MSAVAAITVAPATGPRWFEGRHGPAARATFALLVACFLAVFARAAEVIPPKPDNHFNDYAGIVDRNAAARLNAELAQFERDTSNQLVVAIYPKMQSASSIEDYTVRVAQAWGVGQADKKNGAVLFIFSQDRKLYIQVGYGLEGVIPDARAKQIIENEITPRFRAGDFTGGVSNGVRALMAAARGEYRGTGRTARESRGSDSGASLLGTLFFPAILFIIVIALVRRRGGGRRRAILYDGGGRTIWTSGWGGSSGSSGSSWSSGGGSFSSGGGSFGGGGAGGSW